MALPTETRPARYAAIGAGTLADPMSTVGFIAELDGFGLDPTEPDSVPAFFLGPETDLKPYDPALGNALEVIDVSAEPWTLVENRPFTQAVVIIDAGIAFWNPAVPRPGQPALSRHALFRLQLEQRRRLERAEATPRSQAFARWPTPRQRRRHAKAGGPVSQQRVRRIGQPDPDGLWHGTAIADLAAGATAGTADEVALFGVELPRAVIADYSGGMLTATLAAIFDAVHPMTSAFADRPLTIVMPLGFPAGPQDGSHPAAVEIDLAMARSGRTNIRLVLPAGNHLQDRCHAGLNDHGSPAVVHWDLPPDDHSINSTEIIARRGGPVGLSVAAPGQAVPSRVALAQASYRFVECQGEKVGVVLRGVDTPQYARFGLALWHHRRKPGRDVRAVRAVDPVRDDRVCGFGWRAMTATRSPTAAAPRRPSRFLGRGLQALRLPWAAWRKAMTRGRRSGAPARCQILATARDTASRRCRRWNAAARGRPARPPIPAGAKTAPPCPARRWSMTAGSAGASWPRPMAARGGCGSAAPRPRPVLHARSLVLPNLPPDS